MRDIAPDATTCVPRKRLSRTLDMPEFRCCLFELERLNLTHPGCPRPEPTTGKNRFFAAECVLSFGAGGPFRFGATLAQPEL